MTSGYLASNFAHEAEVRLLRWSDSQRGATITLELPPLEIGEAHPFKGLDGIRFRMRFDPIRDDETVAEVPAPNGAAPVSGKPDAVPGREHKSEIARERFRLLDKEAQTVTRCAMLCQEIPFWRFMEESHAFIPGRIADAETCADFVRIALGINSRSELATDVRAQMKWGNIVTDYDIWRGAIPEVR